jgi:hypothetical protein
MKTLKLGVAAISIAGAALMAASGAQAANLISNGTFASGLSGWTVGGTVIAADGAIYNPCCGTPILTSPTFASFGPGNVTDLNTLSQSFATSVGHTYKVAFASGALGGGSQDLSYALSGGGTNSGTISEIANDSITSTFSPTTFTFVASAASTTLTFSDLSFADSVDPVLTNVSVTGIPEPASWALMLVGVGAVGAGLRSRRKDAMIPA